MPSFELLHVLLHAAQDVLEVFEVGHFHVLLVAELLDDAGHLAATDLPGIKRLEGAAAARERAARSMPCGGLLLISRASCRG